MDKTIYVVIGCDADPDRDYFVKDIPAGSLGWRGVLEGIPRAKEMLAELTDCDGKPPVFTWNLRVDHQVRQVHGAYNYILTEHHDFLLDLEKSGDELAWHPHFWYYDKVALQVYLGYFVGWICYGVSFYTFMNAIMIDPEIPVIAGIGSFVLAYIIGYLAFFSPGGLGARELVLITVTSPFLGPVASGVAVTARVWNLISEVVAAGIALLIKMEGKRA